MTRAMIRRMTLEDTLATLLDLVGQRVDVAIESPAGDMVANINGQLARGHDLTRRDDDTAAPIFFSLDDGGFGFILDPHTFSHADRQFLRIEDRAGVAILVETAADRPA
jgi:hypothetical protein